MTEIYDYLRLLYSRVGAIVCRSCGRRVKKDTIDEIVEQTLDLPVKTRLFISFPFLNSRLDPRSERSDDTIPVEEVWENLLRQGFYRLLLGGHGPSHLVQFPQARPSWEQLESARILVDRLVVQDDIRQRLTDSLEQSYVHGDGVLEVTIFDQEGDGYGTLRFTERFECQYCDIQYRVPEPRLFSFNNPYGACPTCQGFGNTMNLDPHLVIPNRRKTIPEGAIDPISKPRYRRFQRSLEQWMCSRGIALDTPYCELPESIQQAIWTGDEEFSGIQGFFSYLERKKYKMHVRIFISRYRGYTRCPDCSGERLCAEARDVYLGEKRISQLTSLPISNVSAFFHQFSLSESQQSVAEKLLREIKQRLDFLIKVGLKYLTLDRLTSTLSGGEMQRIHLAAALSSSLVGTLYVLDEPSIGLHPRDEHRLIRILKELRDLGNTIVVVGARTGDDPIRRPSHRHGTRSWGMGRSSHPQWRRRVLAPESRFPDRSIFVRRPENSDSHIQAARAGAIRDDPRGATAQSEELDGAYPVGIVRVYYRCLRFGKVDLGRPGALRWNQEDSGRSEGSSGEF